MKDYAALMNNNLSRILCAIMTPGTDIRPKALFGRRDSDDSIILL